MPADILVIPWFAGAATTDCTVSASINGAAAIAATIRDDGTPVITIPDGCTSLSIYGTPTTASWWPIQADFQAGPSGGLVLAAGNPSEVLSTATNDASGTPVSTIFLFPSQLRDVTAQAVDTLQNVPPVRAGDLPDPPVSWQPSQYADYTFSYLPFVGPDDTGQPRLNVGPLTANPDGEWCVFEVAGVTAPQTIAVAWPSSVSRSDGAAPTQFLTYIHPNVGQNAPDFYTHPGVGTYPFGFDYIYFGLWRYLVYRGDPLLSDPYCKGLPAQINASGKGLVLVIPGNKVGPEIGSMLDAAFTDALLRDLQGVMFRRAGTYSAAPGLGRAAMASFSAGNLLLTQFLASQANRQHSFCLDTLREVYFFEAPGDVTNLVAAARAWQSSGTVGDKRIEVFSQDVKPPYRSLAPAVPGMPSTSTSADTLSTVTYAHTAGWQAALNTRQGAGARTLAWGDSHQLVSAIGLTDALSRSLF